MDLDNKYDQTVEFELPEKSNSIGCGISEFDKDHGLPDGGFGWVVVGASFMVAFIVYGMIYSFGQITAYYLSEQFKGQDSTLEYLSTLNIAVLNMSSLVTGRLDDRFGHRICIIVGGTIYSLALLLSAWAYEPWHLLVTQGVVLGLSGSVLSIATISAPMQWFDKKRGLASGISASGCGLGGMVLSPVLTELLINFGAKHVMIGCSVFCFVVLIGSGLIIKDQTKPEKSEVPWHDCSILSDRKFLLLLGGNTITSFGYLLPISLMQKYTTAAGLTNSNSGVIVSVINGASLISRVICGLLADKFGVLNLLLCNLVVIIISVCVIWPVSTTMPSLIVFGLIYGVGFGSFASVPPVVSSQIFGVKGLSTTNGWMYFFAGLPCLLGTPIANAIVKASPNLYANPTSKFFIAIQYGGFTAVLGMLLLLALKLQVSPKFLFKV